MRQGTARAGKTKGPSAKGRRGNGGKARLSPLSPCFNWVALHELWLLAAVSPFLVFTGRWTPWAFALVVFLWLCRWLAWGRITIRTPMDAPLAILMVTALMGLYPSTDLSASLPLLWRMLLGVALFYGLVNGLRSRTHLRWATLLLIAGCLGLALLTLLGTRWSAVRLVNLAPLYEHLPAPVRDIEDSLPFNPRVMGMALATMFPIPLALLLFGEDRDYRLSSGLAVLGMGIVLLLTQSIQALVGIGAALLFLAIWRNRWFLLAIPLGFVVLLGGSLIYGPRELAAMLLSTSHPLGIAVVLRLDMWGQALAMVRDMPYTGIGLNAFPLIQTHFYPGFLIGPEPHAHNLFLQVALDLGLFGLAAFLWLLASFGGIVVRAYELLADRDGRALVMGLAASVLSYLASGSIDTIWTAKPAVLFWVPLGLAMAVFGLASKPGPVKRPHWRARALPGAFLVALLALGILSFPGHGELNLGMIQAHKGLIQARSSGVPPGDLLRSGARHLRRALARDPDHAQAYSLLGSIHAWQGDYAAAVEALDRRVALDGRDPFGRYAPFEALRRRIQGGTGYDPWDDVLRLYSQWMTRFPDRAETYVQAAIVWHRHKGDRARAIALLRSGLARKAQPQGLLVYYLARLEQGKARPPLRDCVILVQGRPRERACGR